VELRCTFGGGGGCGEDVEALRAALPGALPASFREAGDDDRARVCCAAAAENRKLCGEESRVALPRVVFSLSAGLPHAADPLGIPGGCCGGACIRVDAFTGGPQNSLGGGHCGGVCVRVDAFPGPQHSLGVPGGARRKHGAGGGLALLPTAPRDALGKPSAEPTAVSGCLRSAHAGKGMDERLV